VNGHFDYNKTPIAPLGTKGLVYEDPAIRTSWGPHGTDAYYIGPAPKHYRCLCFYMPATRRYRIANTWRLYPTHCTTPSISQANLMVLQATNVLQSLGATIPTSTSKSITKNKAIQQLQEILSPQLHPGTAGPRVPIAPEPRVAAPATRVLQLRVIITPEPRVAAARDTRVLRPTTSNSAAPEMLYPTRPIHQRHTWSNNPFTILEEDKEPDKPNITTDAPTPLQLLLQATIPPYDPFIQEMLDRPQQTIQAIHDLRPQRRAAPTANPTTHPSPTILPRSKLSQTFTPTALPPRKPTKIATLPTGPAYIQHDYEERDDHYNP
jgi:hypothetical protein